MTLTPIQDFLQANMQYNENYSYCRLNAEELGTYNGFDKTVLRDRTDHEVYTFNRMQGTYYRYLLYKETDNIQSVMFTQQVLLPFIPAARVTPINCPLPLIPSTIV